MTILATTKHTKNIPKYNCELCNFKCCVKSDWERHIIRPKHINNSLSNTLATKNDKKNGYNTEHKIEYICTHCNKIYKNRSGLWRHNKVCDSNLNTKNYVMSVTPNIMHNMSNIPSSNVDNHLDNNIMSMFMEVIKQNSEFKELLIEQNKTILEFAKKDTINNTTNNTNTNCNNKFNLNLFLNETCKDAMNMSDFLNQLQLTTKDLELTGQDGFAVGIGHSFVQGIKALEAHKRPLHCSDLKRETFYIKEDNVWEKEDEKRGKLTNAIQKIAHKNILNIPAWKAEHPYCRDQHHKDNDKFLQIMIKSMTGKDDPNIMQEYDKIIRNVAKEVFIDKS